MPLTYDFDRIIDRRGTASVKWDLADQIFGGTDLLPLWVADMDFAAPPEVVAALESRAAHGIFGYTAASDEYYAAIMDWMRTRHGWEIQKEWIHYCPGVVPALFLLVQALSKPGDAVIIQRPVYYPFMKAIETNGRRVVNNPLLLVDGRYKMDMEGLERCAAQSNARILILCSPHNPVGRAWERGELEALSHICRRHDITVIADEIHGDIVLPGHCHIPLSTISEDLAARTITCTAPSKTFNLAGLQTANLIIPDERLRKAWRGAMACAGMWGPNVFGATALVAAYRHGGPWLDALSQYLAGNLRLVKDEFAQRLPRIRIIEPEATYLVWLDFRDYGLTPKELARRIVHDAGLALDHGHLFGSPEGDGFERINIGCPRALLHRSIDQLAAAFGE